ncbi:MAG: pyridoxamine 5'-phosphate oxidase family protein [Candidatus Magnetoovum sp. WYHC-5]|nr:pyridoxamine 5'-phosphate oxidase family protein [Candidatus Magnetoovum sp. WYHC-5]
MNRLPPNLYNWMIDSRVRFLSELAEGKSLRYLSSHLPVMCSWAKGQDDEQFPVNMTVKGIGLLPKIEMLKHYSDIFEVQAKTAKDKPWEDSLKDRVNSTVELYSKKDALDDTVLGGLEIFEGNTLKNLRDNPKVSLLYVGMEHTKDAMKYISYQVNGTVEILEKDNPYYIFLLSARKLFEFEKFHLFQPTYSFGYLIKVVNAIDKSPWSRKG